MLKALHVSEGCLPTVIHIQDFKQFPLKTSDDTVDYPY